MSASTPGLSFDTHAQVVRGFHLFDGQDRQIGELVGLESQMWHAVAGSGGMQTGYVDQVGNHR